MKNSGTVRRILLYIFFAAAGVFCFSCGLETVIYVVEPTKTYNDPLYNSEEFLKWYCSFATEEQANDSSDSSFTGTSVYYKIYNNTDELVSERNSILAVNTSSNNSAAATRLLQTYTYQLLHYRQSEQYYTGKKSTPDLTISTANSNRNVIFRLKSYTGSENYEDEVMENFRSCIKVNNYYWGYTDSGNFLRKDLVFVPEETKETQIIPAYWKSGDEKLAIGTVDFAVPCRINGKSFDFFNDANITGSEFNVEPSYGEADYKHNDNPTSSDSYYVQLFAVGVAFDPQNLSDAYSLVLDLGSVPVTKGK